MSKEFKDKLRELRPNTVIIKFNPNYSAKFYAEICLEWEKFYKELLK